VLYCYRSCPFANKVFAFLDHHAVPYAVVEVNPLFKFETSWQSYKRVPFAIINGKQVNDSDGIISAVSGLIRQQDEAGKSCGRAPAADDGSDALFMPHGIAGVSALSEVDAAREEEWRTWCKEDLVHTLSPNIYRTPTEAWQAFEYIGQVSFSSAYGLPAQCVGAAIMYLVGKRVAKKHGYDPKNMRGALYERVHKWTDEGLAGKPFCGGLQPNLADLAVFGVLRAIEGLE
jgi:microsomal prostaglandin-E synthase 2